MASRIRAYYRRHDDYRRYLATHGGRVRGLSRLFSENKRFFGRSILDVACGGGVLGFIAEGMGRRYLGIDINQDAILGAREHAKKVGSGNRFVLGDARTVRVRGTFDTVTLLGNAPCHFDTAEFAVILDNIHRNIKCGSYFIMDYRDVVQILYQRKWARRFSQMREGRPMVSVTKRFDSVKGDLVIDSLGAGGRRRLEFTHAVWSPFIIEPLMRSRGWSLVRRRFGEKDSLWTDIYRKG